MTKDELDDLIEQYVLIRNTLTDELRKLREERGKLLTPRALRSRPGTAKMFKSEDLRPWIEQWLFLYSRQNEGRSGVRRLSEKARVSHMTVTNILGITNHNGRPQQYVRPVTVDKLCSAMEIPHVYSMLEIVEIPWGQDKVVIPERPYSHCDD